MSYECLARIHNSYLSLLYYRDLIKHTRNTRYKLHILPHGGIKFYRMIILLLPPLLFTMFLLKL